MEQPASCARTPLLPRPLAVCDLVDFILGPRSRIAIDASELVSPFLPQAYIEPPITVASLRSFDVANIINRPKTRYDLNFEVELQLNADYGADTKKLVRDRSQEYWTTLPIEIALYMECVKKPSCECLLNTVSFSAFTWRLPTLFQVLRDILKTVIRDVEWASIDQTLDVEFLMQQLRKGVCDLVCLSTWLGHILKSSCSPMRDSLVNGVIGRINKAIFDLNPISLSTGLKDLFSLFKLMKLDIANHQLRVLKVPMINDSTHFASEHFRERISGCVGDDTTLLKSDVEAAKIWYDRASAQISRDQPHEETEIDGDEDSASDEQQYLEFGMMVRDLIRPPLGKPIPITFEYDLSRLGDLQTEYRYLLSTLQLLRVFEKVLRARGYDGQIPLDDERELMDRIDLLTKEQKCFQPSREVAIEIVRAAYKVQNEEGLPTDEDSRMAEFWLDVVTNHSSEPFKEVERALCDKLSEYLEGQIILIHGLAPMRIFYHYQDHFPYYARRFQPVRSIDYQRLAGRIAHIAVLHWRVWAAILYLASPGEVSTAVRDGSSTTHCSVPSVEPTLRETIPRTREHCTDEAQSERYFAGPGNGTAKGSAGE